MSEMRRWRASGSGVRIALPSWRPDRRQAARSGAATYSSARRCWYSWGHARARACASTTVSAVEASTWIGRRHIGHAGLLAVALHRSEHTGGASSARSLLSSMRGLVRRAACGTRRVPEQARAAEGVPTARGDRLAQQRAAHRAIEPIGRHRARCCCCCCRRRQ